MEKKGSPKRESPSFPGSAGRSQKASPLLDVYQSNGEIANKKKVMVNDSFRNKLWSWEVLLRPLVELCVEPAGLCGRCTGVAVPLRVMNTQD